jgi:hypothetical protein
MNLQPNSGVRSTVLGSQRHPSLLYLSYDYPQARCAAELGNKIFGLECRPWHILKRDCTQRQKNSGGNCQCNFNAKRRLRQVRTITNAEELSSTYRTPCFAIPPLASVNVRKPPLGALCLEERFILEYQQLRLEYP